MKKDEVISKIKTVLSKAGMNDTIRVCEDTNEIGNIMVYQEPGKPEYLVINKRILFDLSVIKNILFAYGDDNYCRHYSGSTFRLTFKLENDVDYNVEFVDGDLLGYISYDGKDIIDDQDVIKKFNRYMLRKNTLKSIFDEIVVADENGIKYNQKEAQEIRTVVEDFLVENPAEIEFLLYYAYHSLLMVMYSKEYPFDIKRTFKMLIQRNLNDDFIRYVKSEIEDTGMPDYNIDVIGTALRLLREAREEVASV